MKTRTLTAALALSGGLVLAQAAQAGVVVTYEAPGVQTSQTPLSTGGVETFDSRVGVSGPFDTDFGTGGTITGTYTGFNNANVYVTPADQYGGAGGTPYAEAFGSYTLTLASTLNPGGVTYFGLYMSAIDAGSEIQFYDGDTLVEALSLAEVQPHLTNPAYYGDQYYEPFAFINVYATDGTAFDKVVLSEPGRGAVESDNHTVGFYTAMTGTVVPEPATWALTIAGFGLAGAALRRRRVLIA